MRDDYDNVNDKYEYCYECEGYSDDYDGDGNWLCPDCPMNPDIDWEERD